MAQGISITKGLANWQFQNNYVERAMDNAAYQAAHPDDTLVLAGPARKASVSSPGATQGIASMLSIGMLQSVSFTQTKPTQPLMMIGSGRSFFVSGKAQTQWSIGRLFVNGRNLNRVLYHNFIAGGGDASLFDDPAALKQKSSYFVNLDSELFYIPFGLAALFRNKAHDLLGSFYAELSMVNSWAVGFNAGQNMILENVTGLSDRILPFSVTTDSTWKASKKTIDQILDFVDAQGPNGNDGEIEDTLA